MALKNINQYFEFYDEGCKVNAPVVVFLPGVACSTWMFREAVLEFLPDHKVLLFNNPGTGKTPLPFNLTVPKIAKIVLEVLKHLSLKKCIFIGHSMGGFTAQQLAYLAPDVVEKLVLISTSSGGAFTRKEAKRIFKDLGGNFWKHLQNFSESPEKAIRYVFSKNFTKNHRAEYKMFAHRFHDLKPKQSTILRHFVCASRFSSHKFLKEISVPTLVIHGNEDKLVDIEGSEILWKTIPEAQFLEIDKCGHFPMIEKKDFYKNIFAFIKGEKIGKRE